MLSLALALVLFACALTLALAAATGRVSLVRVEGESMLPTLQPGDLVLCQRYQKGRSPRTGELVTVRRESFPPLIVKRVLASPGEALPAEISEEESRLPPGRYFLVADNSAQSHSPRWIGPVETVDIQAQAWLVIWPWRRWCISSRRPA